MITKISRSLSGRLPAPHYRIHPRFAVFSRLLPLVCLVIAASVPEVRAQADRPNVVLIVSDDQGYADLSVLGTPGVHTPHLDRLASEGVRLTQFYVTAPVCTPSRASLLTGRYPLRNGTIENFRNDRVDDGYLYPEYEYSVSPERILGLDEREVLISDILQAAGYANGVVGKWDLGQLRRFLPLQRGFDTFYGFVNTGIDYFTHERYGVPSMVRDNMPAEEDRGTYTTTLFQREALAFIDAHRDEPFFLYLSFNAPHNASNLDPEIRGGAQAPDDYLRRFPEPADRAEARRRKYLAAVWAMDDAIGAVLDRLDALGLTDDTLVLFLSDNGGGGGASNAPLRGRKGRLFEGGVRVPAILRWPGRLPERAVSDAWLSTLDIFPTIVRATGAETPANVVLDGFDMLPVLRGERPSEREALFWAFRDQAAARVGRWKWVDARHGRGLFDLESDPTESRDLTAERPDILLQVRARYDAWLSEMEAADPRGPFRDY